jgi:predicted MFS family arabinose efflux permease
LPIALFVLRDRPEDVGELPDGEPRPDTDEPPRPVWGLTLAQAVRRPLFWVLSIALMLYFFGAIGWMTHIVPFYESRGISRDTAAILLSISSGAGIAIRLAIGAYADRFERFEAPASAATALIAIGMALLLIEPGWGGVIAFTALWVIGTSVGPLVESLGLTRAFGLAHFATILGFVVVIETAGEVLSPSVTGAIFDSTDSYDLALVMYITTFALSSLLLAVAAKMRRPDPFAEA